MPEYMVKLNVKLIATVEEIFEANSASEAVDRAITYVRGFNNQCANVRHDSRNTWMPITVDSEQLFSVVPFEED